MSNEMPPTSWRALASAASRHIKGYARDARNGYPASRGPRLSEDKYAKVQAWGKWAGRMLKRGGEDPNSAEKLNLFPGWAARKYHEQSALFQNENIAKPFDLEVFVSGFASKSSPLGFNTRTGRTFLRLAKNYAALPKLVATGVAQALNGSEPPYRVYSGNRDEGGFAPDEAEEDAMLEALQNEVREHELQDARDPYGDDTGSLASSSGSRSPLFNPKPLADRSATSLSGNSPPSSPNLAQRLNSNLETRLANFWNTALPSRQIRISLYATDPTLFDSDDSQRSSSSDEVPEQRPIFTRDVFTQDAGFFQTKLHVPWESMCIHPGALQLAFGESLVEHELFVVAELLPPTGPPTTTVQPPYFMPYPSASASINIPLTYSPVRVISDIDDTVKISHILSGARAVFHQVFAKDLQDSVIPEMADWYNNIWRRGARFHYVSNAPLQMLPILLEFLHLAKLPSGSLKLRTYAGRLLLRDMFTAAAERKRAGLVDILDNFPLSRFILVGDSGEQDLELYASVAKQRPEQILAIFIREATLFDSDISRGTQPLDDPTGEGIFQASSDVSSDTGSASSSPRLPSRRTSLKATLVRPIRSKSDMGSPRILSRRSSRTFTGEPLSAPARNETANGYFSPSFERASPISEEPPPTEGLTPTAPPSPVQRAWTGYASEAQRQPPMSQAERRREDLQMRVWRARLDVPRHIPLRVFRKPEECVEAMEVIDCAMVRT